MKNIEITMNAEIIENVRWTSFDIKLSAKQSRNVLLHPNGTVTIGGSASQQAYNTIGTVFRSFNEAASHYKAKKLKAALEFLPVYVAEGMTGTVTI